MPMGVAAAGVACFARPPPLRFASHLTSPAPFFYSGAPFEAPILSHILKTFPLFNPPPLFSIYLFIYYISCVIFYMFG